MGIYYVELLDVLSDAGVAVGVISNNAGWESRARSSGGFPSAPKGVVWHHTASKTSIESDLQWQCHSCDDNPVGNMTIARDGVVYPVAAGASNCAGKGGPYSFSRGTVAADSGNTGCWNIEVANNGVGEPWPTAQIDSYFASSNALNRHFGNQPTDIVTHNVWAPDRKIDPATAEAVQGGWQPDRINSSGTWDLMDIAAECARRAGGGGGDDFVDQAQFEQMMGSFGRMEAAQQAMYERLGTFGPKADQGISQRSQINDGMNAKLDRIIELLSDGER